MANTCVFCGWEGKLSDEHVWGDWLNKGVWEELPKEIRSQRSRVDGSVEEWDQQPFNQVVKVVCEKCNNGWMSTIESRAIRLLVPMLRATPTRLKPLQQQRVATWAALKAFITEHMQPAHRVIPEADYRDFYVVKRPSGRMHIWLGALAEPIRALTADGLLLTSQRSTVLDYFGDAPDPRLLAHLAEGGYPFCSTMTIGPLLMVVIAHRLPPAVRVSPATEGISRHFVQVWPIQGTVRWPPVPVGLLGDGSVDRLYEHFAIHESAE